jgi:hypothetical protein
MSDHWWSKYFKYRKQLVFDNTNISPPNPALAKVFLPTFLIEQGKIREDLSDIRIVINNTNAFRPSQMIARIQGDSILIEFYYQPLRFAEISEDYIDDRYWVYYGDYAGLSPDAPYVGATPNDDYDLPDDYYYGGLIAPEFSYTYFISAIQDQVGLTRPGEHWQTIDLDNNTALYSSDQYPGASLSYIFYGDKVGLYCNSGPIYGVMEVEIDGVSTEIDLYEGEFDFPTLVFKAENLPDTLHNLVVTNTGRRNPTSIGADVILGPDADKVPVPLYTPINIVAIGVNPYLVAKVGAEEVTSEFNWNSKVGGNI